MNAHAPSRRDFLRSTGFVAMGLATGGSIILAPDYAWALSCLYHLGHPGVLVMEPAKEGDGHN